MKKLQKIPVLTKNYWFSNSMVIFYIACLSFFLHMLTITNFGYFRDELYYLSCTEHLSWGYVDQPPLSIFLLKIIKNILGESLLAIRLLPALCASLFIYLTAIMAREIGGGRFAMILAAITSFTPVGNFMLFHVYSMNFIDMMIWLVLYFILLQIIKSGDDRLWMLFGLIAGIGLLNKISILYLGFGLLLGLVFSRQRMHLKSKYFWYGAGLAILMFLPYIIWNLSKGGPTWEFIHNAKTFKMVSVTPLGFLNGQILYNNPATVVIWLGGLLYLFFDKQGKKYRLFAWIYLTIYVLFNFLEAKDYYLASAYPILFAGGAVLNEGLLKKRNWSWVKGVLICMILIPAILYCPITLPILPVEQTAGYLSYLGISDNSGERHKKGILPQHFADMFGWEEMVAKVNGVFRSLTTDEQNKAIIFATNYGVTGAINFFGKKYGLPTAYSGHNSHFFWPPADENGDLVIVVGLNKEVLGNFFRNVELVDKTECKYCMPYENNKPIFVCTGIKLPLNEVWPKLKNFN